MKKLIYILIILLNINSCKAQKNTEMKQKIIIPKITDEFEKFDIENYIKNNSNGEIRLTEENTLTILIDYKNGFSKAIYLLNSYFSITKNYYKNGNIEIKGISFNNGSEYGIWYEFNEEGKLIKTINTDEGYDFSWKNVITFCEEKEIPLTKGFKEFAGFQTRILKREENGKKVWVISYLLPVGDKIKEITLDGKTGEEISQRTFDLIGG